MSTTKAIILAIFSLGVINVDTAFGNIVCVNGWISHDNECYLFNTTRVSWFRAKQFCQTVGARLVRDDDANKRDFLRSYIRNVHHDSNAQTVGYWTAGNDIEQEGHWKWDYPDGTDMTLTDWAPNEPNNSWYDGRPENCVVIWGHDNHQYHWNDQPCDTLDYFVCETMTGAERRF